MSTTTLDLAIATWRKSSYSQSSSGCLEIAEQFPHTLPIRDSKAPDRAPVIVPRATWAAFVSATDGGALSAQGRLR
ncbi:DUF397 domain-containing protein [Streptomyces caatingaensis]|uniref:DUF397 domain-containing protein n=1 Tax=Streptomyces caatingaensis TaxID=1678637 RepID=A0A0K9XCX5_9ACTN|nr:DUF397 domain-containing protein [Streptomyces caatingaensis]KNB51083.1 hypothetical protein AC230_18240 [Streptomyces caatingaensis]